VTYTSLPSKHRRISSEAGFWWTLSPRSCSYMNALFRPGTKALMYKIPYPPLSQPCKCRTATGDNHLLLREHLSGGNEDRRSVFKSRRIFEPHQRLSLLLVFDKVERERTTSSSAACIRTRAFPPHSCAYRLLRVRLATLTVTKSETSARLD